MWSTGGTAISRILNLAAMVICARILGPREFGEVALLQSTLSMVGLYAGLNLGVTATRYVGFWRAHDVARASRFLSLCSLAGLASAFVFATAFFFSAPAIVRLCNLPQAHTSSFRLGSLILLFTAFNGSQRGCLFGLGGFRVAAALDATASATTPLLMFVLARGWGLWGAVLALVCGAALSLLLTVCGVAVVCRRQAIPTGFRGCYAEAPTLLRFGLPTFMSGALHAPSVWLGAVLLSRQADGLAQMGFYNGAERWKSLILFWSSCLGGVQLSLLSNSARLGQEKAFGAISRLVESSNVLCTAVPALGVAMASPWLMAAYGASFRSSWPLVVIAAASTVPLAMNSSIGQQLFAQERAWTRFLCDCVVAITTVALSLLLVPAYRARGLAATNLIAAVVGAVAVWTRPGRMSASLERAK